MQAFIHRDGQLFAEGVALSAIAQRFGTPTYIYSRAHIEAQYHAYADALQGMPHLVCFAVKANSNASATTSQSVCTSKPNCCSGPS
jgi:diaminopimelate decarboxylase